MMSDFCAYLGGIIRELKGTALVVNRRADHVHLLVRVPPVPSLAEITRVLKSNSSKWFHQKWPDRKFAWQSGYGAFSVIESNVPAVTRYLAQQEKHHTDRSFREEFLAFLAKNNIVVNERYLWN